MNSAWKRELKTEPGGATEGVGILSSLLQPQLLVSLVGYSLSTDLSDACMHRPLTHIFKFPLIACHGAGLRQGLPLRLPLLSSTVLLR